MPSCQLCSSFPPHFPNQEPPWPQQLALPDLLITPHARQADLAVVVTSTVMNVWGKVKRKNNNETRFVSLSLYIKPLSLHPPLQASTPSNQLCCIPASPTPPQFLYQAPPGAQQLRRPDFLNVPQVGHTITPRVAADVVDACQCASHR